MTTRRGHSKLLRAQHAQSWKGSVLVEFAVILPVFLLILLGTVSFSLALYNKTVLTMATREGARAGAVYTDNQTNANIISSATAATLQVCQGNLISFAPGMTPAVITTIDSSGSSGSIITVSANVIFTGLFVLWNPPDLQISAQTSMKIE